MRKNKMLLSLAGASSLALLLSCNVTAKDSIVHDAEYYVLHAQNGEKWALEDDKLNKKLVELCKKHGQPPNIIHIMWDDTAYGDVGIPAIQKIRGFETPNLHKMLQMPMNKRLTYLTLHESMLV